MKKKIIIIILILIIFIIFLTINKYNMGTGINKKKHYFEFIEIKNYKDDNENDDIIDKDIYSDKIIKDDLLSIDYNFFDNEESITGTIYIGDDKYLYITDSNNNLTHRVSTVKFKTMYAKNYEYEDGVFVYLLSEDGKVYIMSLTENDITKVNIYDYRCEIKFVNFVDIDFDADIEKPGNTLFVLAENGKIYDINTGLRYSDKIVSLQNSLYVFEDNTLSTVDGREPTDKDGKPYRIKYLFITHDDNKFSGNYSIVVITDDDRYIYFDDKMIYTYEFNKKVKDIDFNVKYPYITDELKITFEDNYKVEFSASCSDYYCINEFAE